METTQTTESHRTCDACGARYYKGNTWMYGLLFHMVNAGEITVGEAKAELRDGILTDGEANLLAGWIMEHIDDDDYRAAPVTERNVHPDWADEYIAHAETLAFEFPAGSYDGGL